MKKYCDKLFSILLSFSMLFSSFGSLASISYAGENEKHENKFELNEGKVYEVKFKIRTVVINDGTGIIEDSTKFNRLAPSYGGKDGYAVATGKINYSGSKYKLKIPILSSRVEQNFSADVPENIQTSAYQLVNKDSEGKFHLGDILENISKSGEWSEEVGQYVQKFVYADVQLDRIDDPIYIRATLSDIKGNLTNKRKMYMEYKLDTDDLKSQFPSIDSKGVKELLDVLASNLKKNSDGEVNKSGNQNNIDKIKNKIVLKDESEFEIPQTATKKEYEEMYKKLFVDSNGIDMSKYSKYIVVDDFVYELNDVISGHLKMEQQTEEYKLNLLKLISLYRKDHYKGLLLGNGERIRIPLESDSEISSSSDFEKDLKAVAKFISKKDNTNNDNIDLSAYPKTITINNKEIVIADKLKIYGTKYLLKKENKDEIKAVFEELVRLENNSTQEDNFYQIYTRDGIKTVEKSSVLNVDANLYETIKKYIESLDESKYSWSTSKYTSKQDILNAYQGFKKENSGHGAKKLKTPEILKISAGKNSGKFEPDKVYPYDDFNGIEILIDSHNDILDNRPDLKFTLDGSEPNENSESLREVNLNNRKLDIKYRKSSNYEPLGNLPQNINDEGVLKLRVKAFAKGMEPSETFAADIKHTALYSENFINMKTVFNGSERDAMLGPSGRGLNSEIPGYGMYVDTRLDLSKVTEGNQYENIRKKLNEKGMSVFSVLDYRLLGKDGKPVKIHDGEWNTYKFKFTEEELKADLKFLKEPEENYKKYKDLYKWSLTIDMDKNNDLYPILLDNSKVKVFRFAEDGSLMELTSSPNEDAYIDLGLLNGKNKDTKKLCFDINNHKGKIVIAEVNDDKKIDALKSEYKKLVDYLNTEKAKARYNKEQLDKLYIDAKAKLGTIGSNSNKEQVKNNLDELKLAITRLDSNYDKPEDIMLKNALAKAKDPVTKVLKTKASKEKLEAVVKKVEEKMSSMTDKDKLASIEEINYAISELKLVNKDFARQPELKDGEYLVPIQMRHFFKMSDTSMGNGAVEGLAKLIVKGDKQELEFNVSGVQIGDKYGRLMKLFYYDIAEGQKADYSKMIEDMSKPGKTITKENTKGIDGVKRDYIRRVSIPLNLDKKNPVRYIGVSVDVMNQLFSPDHKATDDILQIGGLVIDYTQIKPADNKDPQPQPQPDPQPEPGPNTEKEWTVPAKLLHGYVDKDSMGNAALIKTSKIKRTKDGKYTYTINFKGISRNWGTDTFYGHLYGIKVYKDGVDSKLSEELNPVSMTKDKDLYGKEREFPLEYTITRDSLDEVIFVEVAVDAMDMIKGNNANPYETKGIKWKGSQTARLVFDLSSINQDKPKPDENPKVSKEIKDLLAKDIELAESIIKSGVVTGNAKSLIETAIASAKKVLKDPKSTNINYLTAREVLRFSMANIKKDPNGNNGKVDDNLIDDPNDKDKKDEDKKNKVKKYKVPVKMIQAYNHNKDSMGDKALDREAIIYTKDGKSTIYLGMKGISIMNKYGHLTDMLVYPGSSMSSEPQMAKVYKSYTDRAVDGKNRTFPRIIAFNRPTTKEDKIYIKVYVDAMDSISSNADSYDKIVKGSGAQNALLVFDWSKAKDISGQDGINFDVENEEQVLDKKTERLAGNNRYATSAKISQKYFKSADTVVLASGKNNADALVSASFANLKKAPILLTDTYSTDDSVVREIERLKAKNVIIVGGASSVGHSVETNMKSKGYNVRRLSGATRYETSAMIAQEVKDATGSNKAILINGSKEADALTVSSLATKQDLPVIMAKSNGIDRSVKDKLDSWNLKEIYVVGGEGSLPNSVVDKAKASNKKRIAGRDRYQTAMKIAEESYPNSDRYMIANAYNPIDALSAGAVTAKANMPILLVNKANIPQGVRTKLDKKAKGVILLGGENTITTNILNNISLVD